MRAGKFLLRLQHMGMAAVIAGVKTIVGYPGEILAMFGGHYRQPGLHEIVFVKEKTHIAIDFEYAHFDLAQVLYALLAQFHEELIFRYVEPGQILDLVATFAYQCNRYTVHPCSNSRTAAHDIGSRPIQQQQGCKDGRYRCYWNVLIKRDIPGRGAERQNDHQLEYR